MSWSCSGSSNKQLVQNMFNAGILKSKSIVNAMTATDRACYVTKVSKHSDISKILMNYFMNSFMKASNAGSCGSSNEGLRERDSV